MLFAIKVVANIEHRNYVRLCMEASRPRLCLQYVYVYIYAETMAATNGTRKVAIVGSGNWYILLTLHYFA